MKDIFRKLVLIYSVAFILPLQQIYAAQHIKGIVWNAETQEPIAFATIRAGNSDEAWISDINGKFEGILPDTISLISISCIGFESKTLHLTGTDTNYIIPLQPSKEMLESVVVTPPYDKIRYIINQAIAHKKDNRPEANEWYRCAIYHKIWADYIVEKRETDTQQHEIRFVEILDSFMDKSHLLLMETMTRRTFHAPYQLQDEVIASRISGWKAAPFTSLITDILPFDAYQDFIKLNGKDYFNPISKGWNNRYHFYLADEIYQGTDTTFILSFKPKQGKDMEAMEGRVYIHSGNYAITHFSGKVKDKKLKRTISIEQQYQWIQGRCFPFHLNFEIAWNNLFQYEKQTTGLVMQGRSEIDSIDFAPHPDFHFDQSKTTKIQSGALAVPDSSWNNMRPIALNEKEVNTYQQIDSLVQHSGAAFLLNYAYKFAEAKIPIGFADINIDRLFSYNRFEHSRWGIGLQTNEKIYAKAAVGGWAGFGMADRQWKYGIFLNICPDSFQDKMLTIGYRDDLQDPGRILMHPDLDRNNLRRWLMYRADRVKEGYFDAHARFGYWNVGIEGHYQYLLPQYFYNFQYHNEKFQQFHIIEGAVNLRYAFAERRSPVFQKYLRSDNSKFPVVYLKITAGKVYAQPDYESNYLKLTAALSWEQHLNRIGSTHLLVMTGLLNSNKPLPLSMYFAGRGWYNPDYPIYSPGGFITMNPYAYYSDRFLSVFWKHDFTKRLYHTSYSAPFISVAYNILVGDMKHTDVHQGIVFQVPRQPYQEAGLIGNDLLRFNYLNVAYLNFNIGYFYHHNPRKSWQENSRLVAGISFDL